MKPMWPGQAGEDVHELAPLGGREPGGGLVEQDEARRPRERERDLELALLAIGELGDPGVAHRRQPHRLDQLVGLGGEGVAPPRAQEREAPSRDAPTGEIDVVRHREPGEEQADLISPAQTAPDALIGGENRHILAEEPDGARGRQEIPRHAVEQRGLASTVRAENRAPLARADGQRHVRDRGECAEHLGHAPELERGAGRDLPERLGEAHGRALRMRSAALSREAHHLSQRPSTPSGEKKTMTRKPNPISILKRSLERSSAVSTSGENVRSST